MLLSCNSHCHLNMPELVQDLDKNSITPKNKGILLTIVQKLNELKS